MAELYQMENKKLKEMLLKEQKREVKELQSNVQDLTLQAWEDLRSLVFKVVEDEEAGRKKAYEALLEFTKNVDNRGEAKANAVDAHPGL